ncbi:MAG: hypothetical protein HKN16_00720 [Saprospiraceae bacterium]|nr:hypothetical protein [Saprospiraceae bacterium]
MIVHIGYHKTGTTFLQNRVFPFLEGIDYKEYHTSEERLRPIFNFTTPEYLDWKKKNHVDSSINSLYSYEGLVGTMGLGTYNLEIGNRLKESGFQKVIITIRRQDRMLESVYRQYVQQGGVLKPQAFISDSRYFRWSYLDYFPLIDHYAQLFGPENILILTQEELKSNQNDFVQRIVEFCGSGKYTPLQEISGRKSNRSLSYFSIKTLRVLNHFTYNFYRPSHVLTKRISTWKFRLLFQRYLDPWFMLKVSGAKKFYSEALAKKVRLMFRDSNEELEKKFKVPMLAMGFYQEELTND